MQCKPQTYTVRAVKKMRTGKLHHPFHFFISNYVLQACSSLKFIGWNFCLFYKNIIDIGTGLNSHCYSIRKKQCVLRIKL